MSPPGSRVAPLPALARLRSTWRYGRVPLIEPLLQARIVPREWPFAAVDGVVGWGRKITGLRAQRLAQRLGLPCLLAEDGLLRSIGLGHAEAALSIVLDDVGIYYDARCPSRLEALVRAGHDAAQCERALRLAAAWRAGRVSKYNHAREAPGSLAAGDVLVVDQTAGDESIGYGLADARSFGRMLEAALDEHPRSRIVLKVHPDVVAGRKRGHFERLSATLSSRVALLATDAHPPSLLEAARAVYVVSSQMGFEALLWGRPVRCFGMPFYAGWGLTGDELPAPDRRGAASLASLVHAALIDYARYVDPETLQRCEAERLLEWMALQRRMRERFAPDVHAAGFRGRESKALAAAFFAGSRLHFVAAPADAPAGACIAAWRLAPAPGLPAIHVDAGPLAALGVAARSWLFDRGGDPHDGGAASDLERILATRIFDEPGLLHRARRLREALVAGTPEEPVGQRPSGSGGVLLVAAEAGVDPAPLLAAVRAEAPDAQLVPHVGVASRAMLAGVDAVHTVASPVGLQALLHGLKVVCHGRPFYAGWGLTEDRLPLPRRGRRLTLDEFVAGALIVYPAYLSRATGRFTSAERALAEAQARRRTGAASTLADLRRWLQDPNRRRPGPGRR